MYRPYLIYQLFWIFDNFDILFHRLRKVSIWGGGASNNCERREQTERLREAFTGAARGSASGVATGDARGQSATPDSEKNYPKSGKEGGKAGKIGKKRKNREEKAKIGKVLSLCPS